jgi:hypothetical protein
MITSSKPGVFDMFHYRLIITIFLHLLLLTSYANATATREWTEKNLGETGAGTYDGIMYSDKGRLAPGIMTEKKVFREDLSFWAGVYEKSGTLLTGGGMPPFVVRLDKDGAYKSLDLKGLVKEGKDATSSVSVMRTISQDRIVVGYSGSGVIGILKPGNFDAIPLLCKLPVRGVWDLVESDGFLYAATWPLGQIYRINLSNASYEIWAQIKDTNVRSLCWSKGRLLAGGGDSGNLYEIKGKEKVETIHHFEEESIQRIVDKKDGLVVAVNRLRTQSDEKKDESYQKYYKKLTDLPQGFGIDEKMPPPPDQMRATVANLASGALYLVGKDYRIDRLASLKDEHILDARVDGDGRIYIATGPKGRVYMVRGAASEERELWTVQEFDYVNATAVVIRDGSPRAFLAAGNEAAAFIRSDKQTRSGSFRTRNYTSGRPARWGALTWRGSGVRVYTRNGHSPKPDSTWTKWMERKNGIAPEKLNKAWSFAQIRIDMVGKGEFYGFTWRFTEKNQRPIITSLMVGDRELTKSGPQRQITWEANDPNNDKLEYRIAVREESSSVWQDVNGSKSLTEAKFPLPLAQLPDGRYHLRITASDAPSNYESPLASSRISPLFVVNNGRPEIKGLNYDQASARLNATVSDRLSIITDLAISVDGGEWRSIPSADGILDERQEEVRVALPGIVAGNHSVALRAIDEAGNESVAQITASFSKSQPSSEPEKPVVDDDLMEEEAEIKPEVSLERKSKP